MKTRRRAADPPKEQRAEAAVPMTVLVTGMHRSGTSAVAGALHAAGLFGGESSGFMRAAQENPAGYWEREGVRQFNDRLLASLGWTWDTPPAVAPSVAPQRASFVDEGRRLVQEMVGEGHAIFIKDPRISLLLPWWRQILFDRLVVVISTRSRDEVAWSLSVRDGFPVPLGEALAAAYDRHLAKGLAGLPVVIVSYRALVSDPKATVVDLLARLDGLGIKGADDEEAAAASVKPGLRRATRPAGLSNGNGRVSVMPVADDPGSPVAVIESFDLEPEPPAPWETALLEAQRVLREERDRTAEAKREADEARGQVDAARAAAMIATDEQRAVTDRVSELESQRIELEATIDELRADVDALRVHASKLEEQRDDARATTDRLRLDADAVRARASALETTRDELNGTIDQLRRTVEELRGEGEALRAQASAIDAERADLRKALDEVGPAAERLRTEGEVLRARAAALEVERDQQQRTVEELRAEGEALRARTSALEAEAEIGRTRGRYARIVRPARRVAKGLWLLVTLQLWRHLRTNHLFEPDWYLARYPDVRDSGLDPRKHYWSQGAHEGRDPNPMFDTTWYLEQNPDVAQSGLNPLDHYWFFGAAEGRDPSPRFDTDWYLEQNPDVRAMKMHPLLHYLRYGAQERRAATPVRD